MIHLEDGALVRQATARDTEDILELLTHYEVPRSIFEPYYIDDPTWRPEHSWIVEREGIFMAHVRVFDRTVLGRGLSLRVGGIGNVVTDREARGRGYAGRLLEAVLDHLTKSSFPYSLLWTHIPGLYGKYGWAEIQQAEMRVEATSAPRFGAAVRKWNEDDLPSLERLYRDDNARRTGPQVRDQSYWEWLTGNFWRRDDHLLVAVNHLGDVAGYLLYRPREERLQLLDLAAGQSVREATLESLMAAVATRPETPLVGRAPLSLQTALPGGSAYYRVTWREQPGLMGRSLNLAALTQHVSARSDSGTGGQVQIEARPGNRVSLTLPGHPPEIPLTQQQLGHLLFHGMDEAGSRLLGGVEHAIREVLRDLFPPQDFVIWEADGF